MSQQHSCSPSGWIVIIVSKWPLLDFADSSCFPFYWFLSGIKASSPVTTWQIKTELRQTRELLFYVYFQVFITLLQPLTAFPGLLSSFCSSFSHCKAKPWLFIFKFSDQEAEIKLLIVFSFPSWRWYCKNITRTEAEQLLRQEVGLPASLVQCLFMCPFICTWSRSYLSGESISGCFPGQRRWFRGAGVQSEGRLHCVSLYQNIKVIHITTCKVKSWLAVSKSEKTECSSLLLVCFCSTNGDIKHYQIKITDTGQFFLAEKHTFKTIPDVIHYHEHNAAGTCTPTMLWIKTTLLHIMLHLMCFGMCV